MLSIRVIKCCTVSATCWLMDAAVAALALLVCSVVAGIPVFSRLNAAGHVSYT